jgi:hypothetical protein
MRQRSSGANGALRPPGLRAMREESVEPEAPHTSCGREVKVLLNPLYFVETSDVILFDFLHVFIQQFQGYVMCGVLLVV